MGKTTRDQLEVRLERLLPAAGAVVVTVYRSSTPKYAKESDLLTGAGSKLHGGRWNPAGIAVVYGSLSPETAMAETLAHNRYYEVPIEDAMPRTFVAIEAKLQNVLDFREGVIRRRLQVSLERMLTVDWRKEAAAGREPITQRIGQAAAAVGLEGLIVPSAADQNGHNLLIFPANLRSGSQLGVLHASSLAT